MAVDLCQHRESIIRAWKEVVDDKVATNWVVFGYEGLTDILTVVSKGDGGIDEMKEEFNSGKIMYAFCRVLDPKTSLNKFVLVNWQGEGAPLFRKGICANHIREVSNLLKGAHVTINARTEDDVDEEIVIEKVAKSTGSVYSFDERLDLSKDGFQKVNPAYQKVEARKEINVTERDKFWAQEEEQEKKRQEEELKKKREEQLRLEQERLKREADEAKKREQMIVEKIKTTEFKKEQKQETPHVPIINKIEQIERPKCKSDEIKEQRKKEAEELIAKRTVNARAVFEQNTSVGQLSSISRKSSLPQVNGDTTRSVSIIKSNLSENKVNENVAPSKIKNNLSEMKTNENTVPLKTKTDNVSPIFNNKSSAPIREQNGESKDDKTFACDTGQIVKVLHVDEVVNVTVDQKVNATENEVDELKHVDFGLQAQALYDYQAADETEISFDPGDIITHIEQIDPGWWQGLGPDGNYGLFPANYVELL